MEVNYVFLALIGLFAAAGHAQTRAKRQSLYSPPLVTPYGATFKLIAGIGLPIYIPGRTLVYGQNFQFQYVMPKNASFFTNYFSSKRRRRSSTSNERTIAYRLLEHQFERIGIDGKECMMRSICEAAETPLQEEGLVGELIHVLLTPDYGGNTHVEKDYIEAKEAGGRGENCSELFPACLQGQGILDRVTTVEYLP